MDNGLVRVYESLADAEQARDALLAAGLPASRVQLTTNEDDATLLEGNAAADPKSDSIADDSYDRNFAEVVQHGVFVLAVEAHDEQEQARAAEVLQRFGGIDVDARIAGGTV